VYCAFSVVCVITGVLCYAIRNPEEERAFVSADGYITDLRLIDAMSSYVATREFEILMPFVR